MAVGQDRCNCLQSVGKFLAKIQNDAAPVGIGGIELYALGKQYDQDEREYEPENDGAANARPHTRPGSAISASSLTNGEETGKQVEKKTLKQSKVEGALFVKKQQYECR